jgi:hypothetical protein
MGYDKIIVLYCCENILCASPYWLDRIICDYLMVWLGSCVLLLIGWIGRIICDYLIGWLGSCVLLLIGWIR